MHFYRVMAKFVILAVLAVLNPVDVWGKATEVHDKIWRIACVESGPYSDYQKIFKGISLGLARQHIVQNGNPPIPADSEELRPIWDWMSENAGGNSVRFVKDAFYTANWDSAKREEITQKLFRRIQTKKDIDLILAFGTWAGQDMKSLDTDIPVIVVSVTNAVESKIIDSVHDSGKDNLAATIEPNRYEHHIKLFHDIFNFKKLGIVYEDTPSGRNSIALKEIENMAQKLNVELVRCTDFFDIPDADLAAKRVKICHEKLAGQDVDAVYLTLNIGLQAKTLPDVLSPLINAGIPTFSQLGQLDVKHGALLSLSQLNIEEEGIFAANQIEQILQGKKPRELNQIFESIVSFAINLRTANLIGWNPPFELLVAIDEFYQTIE